MKEGPFEFGIRAANATQDGRDLTRMDERPQWTG
jgi:hypothetical protein